MKPNKRREGREAALQLLYSQESLPNADELDLAAFWEMRLAAPDVRRHAETLWRGVAQNMAAIDSRITLTLTNFSFERLAAVDRNILRVACYEIFHDTTVPPVVSMNEAIEIAKRFGGEDSGKFVNGILDKLLQQVERPLR